MRVTRQVKEILSWYASENPGVKTNLARILIHGKLAGTGKLVILPVDQGFEHGPARSFAPNPAAYDPHYLFELALEPGSRLCRAARPPGAGCRQVRRGGAADPQAQQRQHPRFLQCQDQALTASVATRSPRLRRRRLHHYPGSDYCNRCTRSSRRSPARPRAGAWRWSSGAIRAAPSSRSRERRRSISWPMRPHRRPHWRRIIKVKLPIPGHRPGRRQEGLREADMPTAPLRTRVRARHAGDVRGQADGGLLRRRGQGHPGHPRRRASRSPPVAATGRSWVLIASSARRREALALLGKVTDIYLGQGVSYRHAEQSPGSAGARGCVVGGLRRPRLLGSMTKGLRFLATL